MINALIWLMGFVGFTGLTALVQDADGFQTTYKVSVGICGVLFSAVILTTYTPLIGKMPQYYGFITAPVGIVISHAVCSYVDISVDNVPNLAGDRKEQAIRGEVAASTVTSRGGTSQGTGAETDFSTSDTTSDAVSDSITDPIGGSNTDPIETDNSEEDSDDWLSSSESD